VGTAAAAAGPERRGTMRNDGKRRDAALPRQARPGRTGNRADGKGSDRAIVQSALAVPVRFSGAAGVAAAEPEHGA